MNDLHHESFVSNLALIIFKFLFSKNLAMVEDIVCII